MEVNLLYYILKVLFDSLLGSTTTFMKHELS